MIGSGNKLNKEELKRAIDMINQMIYMSRTDKSIDVSDLMLERANAYRALNKIRHNSNK